jgi:hypothetical protein
METIIKNLKEHYLTLLFRKYIYKIMLQHEAVEAINKEMELLKIVLDSLKAEVVS